jgi:hypothetical protein
VLAVVATIAVVLPLSIALSSAAAHVDTLSATVAEQDGEIDSLKGRVQSSAGQVKDLRTTAKNRESELIAMEEAAIARSTALDVREGAIKSAEAVVASNTFAGDGTFVVGTDVQPGLYRSEGGPKCYWARLNASGDDIIDNELASGPAVLTIQPSDGLIKTSRCAPFTKAS